MIILLTLAAVALLSVGAYEVYKKGYRDGLKQAKKRK